MKSNKTYDMGWIGVDLDGTLAHYDHWRGADHIGDPIERMVDRVREWLAAGKDVRIFTARLGQPKEADVAKPAIEAWCLTHLGRVLPITATKDMHMVELWDDRCVQVIPNTGHPVQPYPASSTAKGARATGAPAAEEKNPTVCHRQRKTRLRGKRVSHEED